MEIFHENADVKIWWDCPLDTVWPGQYMAIPIIITYWLKSKNKQSELLIFVLI